MPPSQLSFLKPEVRKDVKFVLEKNQEKILNQFASYKDCIRESILGKIKSNLLSLQSFCAYLLDLDAFEHCYEEMSCKFEAASNIYAVFRILRGRSSFWDFAIFESQIDHYELDRSQKKLKYREYFEEYIKKHNVSEFIEIINHPLYEKECITGSSKLVLVFDIEYTCKMAKVKDLLQTVGRILDMKPSSLLLYDIQGGSVCVTLLISARAAEQVFVQGKVFTASEVDQLRAISVLKLSCGEEFSFDFTSGKILHS